MDKLKKNSKIKFTSVLNKTYFFNQISNYFIVNKNLILCKLAHLIVYSYIRLYGGYYIVQHLYNYMEYELFIGGLFLYLLCWIGIFILLQETRDEIKKIYRKSQLDLCHQY